MARPKDWWKAGCIRDYGDYVDTPCDRCGRMIELDERRATLYKLDTDVLLCRWCRGTETKRSNSNIRNKS